MVRSVLGGVAWVGRTASMVFGLALVLALVFGAVSVGLAANGKPFILGKATNVATKATGLVGRVAAGEALVVKNPSGGSALGLSVGDPLADPAAKTVAPMKVDSQARVVNLNADKIDGKDSTEIGVNGREQVTRASILTDSSSPKSALATCPQGKILVGTGFEVLGVAPEVVVDKVEARPDISESVEVEAHEAEPTTNSWRLEASAICVTAP